MFTLGDDKELCVTPPDIVHQGLSQINLHIQHQNNSLICYRA
jgi:hypothetical protein